MDFVCRLVEQEALHRPLIGMVRFGESKRHVSGKGADEGVGL
jgi:hypothetical protein